MVKLGYKKFLDSPGIFSVKIPKGAESIKIDVDTLFDLKPKIKEMGEFTKLEFSHMRVFDSIIIDLDISTKKPMSPEFWKKVRDFAMTELKSKKIITFLRPTGYEEVKQESQG